MQQNSSRERAINVLDFGAHANGIDDDSLPIRNALEALKRSGGGGIFFPRGTYLFSHIALEANDIEIFGNDARLVSTLPIGTEHPAIWIRGKNVFVHDITIDHLLPLNILNFEDMKSRKPNAYGLRIGALDGRGVFTNNIKVHRVNVLNSRGGGIQISKASNVSVTYCTVNQALGNGIGFDGCPENVIANWNSINNTGDDLLVIVTDSSVPQGTKNVKIMSNKLSKGFAKGVATSGVDGCEIYENTIEQTYAGGIVIMEDIFYNLGKSKNVRIHDNTIIKSGMMFGRGLFRSHASNVGSSVYISSGTSDVSVYRNRIMSSIRDGIVATATQNLSITQNQIIGHPHCGIMLGDVNVSGARRIDKLFVENNIIMGSKIGIAAGSVSNGIIRYNCIDLKRNVGGFGLYVGNISNLDISNNTILGGRLLQSNKNDATVKVEDITSSNIFKS